MLKKTAVWMVFLIVMVIGLVACGAAEESAAPAEEAAPAEAEADGTGTLEFIANGEDFARQTFSSKDGWDITLENSYITIADLTAYQTDPPYNAESGEMPEGTSVTGVENVTTLDLSEGDENAEPLLVNSVEAPAGQYNALAWRMVPATEGAAAGYSVMFVGTAEKEGETVDFTIKVPNEYTYTCGEFVGDERKGILEGDEAAEVEATFHFDHIFGDGEAPADDSLNVGALGFDPLAAVAEDGVLDADMTMLEAELSEEEFNTLTETLATLGHVGEGHCFEATGGYTGAHGEES